MKLSWAFNSHIEIQPGKVKKKSLTKSSRSISFSWSTRQSLSMVGKSYFNCLQANQRHESVLLNPSCLTPIQNLVSITYHQIPNSNSTSFAISCVPNHLHQIFHTYVESNTSKYILVCNLVLDCFLFNYCSLLQLTLRL